MLLGSQGGWGRSQGGWAIARWLEPYSFRNESQAAIGCLAVWRLGKAPLLAWSAAKDTGPIDGFPWNGWVISTPVLVAVSAPWIH